MGRPAINLTNQVFGLLRVLVRVKSKSRGAHWRCQCQCGNLVIVSSSNLRSGITRACGCRRIKHKESTPQSPEYKAWLNMKRRCENSKRHNWHRYGGRGIKVCRRWQNSFKNFLTDLGRKPTAKHSLDRYPNPDGNYSPMNCRWANGKQQIANQSRKRPNDYETETETSVD